MGLKRAGAFVASTGDARLDRQIPHFLSGSVDVTYKSSIPCSSSGHGRADGAGTAKFESFCAPPKRVVAHHKASSSSRTSTPGNTCRGERWGAPWRLGRRYEAPSEAAGAGF